MHERDSVLLKRFRFVRMSRIITRVDTPLIKMMTVNLQQQVPYQVHHYCLTPIKKGICTMSIFYSSRGQHNVYNESMTLIYTYAIALHNYHKLTVGCC